MFHSLPNITLGHKKEVGLCKTRDHGQSSTLSLAPTKIQLPWWWPEPEHMLRSLNMVHFCFTPSLGFHQLHSFVFPTIRLVSRGPHSVMITALGLCVKWPCTTPQHTSSTQSSLVNEITVQIYHKTRFTKSMSCINQGSTTRNMMFIVWYIKCERIHKMSITL